MNFTKLLLNIQNSVKELLKKNKLLGLIISKIDSLEAKAYLVGGAVRDIILNNPIKDIDIEVHNLELNTLTEILKSFGEVSYVGKSFGVLKISGINADWSLPRKDSAGRKPEVKLDPYMGINKALKRRDLTINAMAIDLSNFDLIDPFNGISDIENKILRSPDIKFFTQDPLRFYRVMQFISRFQMNPDQALNSICKTMDISKVSVERIQEEFEKLLLKSDRPSLGIRWIKSINRLEEILPELNATVTVMQEPIWHPEGTVFEHLMQTLDASALFAYKDQEEKLIIMFASLCHDLGKAVTTIIAKDGRIHSPGHAAAGVPIALSLLKRITKKKKLLKPISLLVKYHMEPFQFVKSNSTLAAYRRLALKLNGYASLEMLSKLVTADRQGRNGDSSQPLSKNIDLAQEFIKRAKQASVFIKPEQPILTGSDIKDIVKPGPAMGELLKYAYNLQINKNIKNKKKLKELLIEKLKKSLH